MTEAVKMVESCGCGIAHGHLTRREVDVLLLMAADHEDTEIARRLGVSVGTVHTHMKSMRYKAGARHRSGLLMRCYAVGVLLPGQVPPEWSGKTCLGLSTVTGLRQ